METETQSKRLSDDKLRRELIQWLESATEYAYEAEWGEVLFCAEHIQKVIRGNREID